MYMMNHSKNTQIQEQKSCDHTGCWLGFLNRNPEFFNGNQTHTEEQHNDC